MWGLEFKYWCLLPVESSHLLEWPRTVGPEDPQIWCAQETCTPPCSPRPSKGMERTPVVIKGGGPGQSSRKPHPGKAWRRHGCHSEGWDSPAIWKHVVTHTSTQSKGHQPCTEPKTQTKARTLPITNMWPVT